MQNYYNFFQLFMAFSQGKFISNTASAFTVTPVPLIEGPSWRPTGYTGPV
jgi:hypothetical protein